MVRLHVVAAILSVGMTLSCQSGPDDTLRVTSGSGSEINTVVPPLEGTHWEFVEVEGKPVARFENEDTAQIRLISAGHILEGTYETDGASLQLHPTPVTFRDCLESNGQEETIRRAIQIVTGYRIDGDRLILLAQADVVAVLMPMGTR